MTGCVWVSLDVVTVGSHVEGRTRGESWNLGAGPDAKVPQGLKGRTEVSVGPGCRGPFVRSRVERLGVSKLDGTQWGRNTEGGDD